MKKTTVLFLLLGIIIMIGVIFAAAITLSAPKSPPVMESIAAPFRTMNFTTLPSVSHYSAQSFFSKR